MPLPFRRRAAADASSESSDTPAFRLPSEGLSPPPAAAPVPGLSTVTDARPDPPVEARHFVVLVLDSLRYDACMTAGMVNMQRLGPIERRWSYASWTAPSHYNLMMGLLPHASPTRVYASEYYKADFLRYQERLGIEGIEFKSLLPSIYMPSYLRNVLGYETAAMVSMPVLNPYVPINRDFDRYQLMPRHNDLAGMIDLLRFDSGRPSFYLLNAGETHYPYALPDEDPSEWPRISGVHGVVKHLDDESAGAPSGPSSDFFDPEDMDRLRQRQIRSAGYVDGLLEKLYDVVPPNTWIVITSDHGELFGEGGMFGHGPVAHDKVFEVPFAEGLLR